MRTITAGTAALAAITALTIAGCASTPSAKTSTVASAAPSATASATPAPAPAPVPSPDGKYSGSCDYTLGDNPAGGTAVAVGEVDETNTGNVGEKVRVRISWPQEGFAPIVMVKHARVPFGGTKAVRFHLPLSSDQLDNLQNWQEGHNFRDGCHYHTVITGTYGAAH